VEENVDHATQVLCSQFPSDGDLTSISVLDRLQFPRYTIAYTSYKTVAVVQADIDESVYDSIKSP